MNDEKKKLLLERLEFIQRMSSMPGGFVSLGWAMDNILGIDKKKIQDYFKK